ncbi:restriction endonuclease subunit S [Helicobacter pylori]|uniref:restriction endonuclease subunit S n=1 Tax=Helicobacter pylori TaxID=210 RepID=UPI0013F3F563|nr:restriction endonuclease subunit S [Helicobacter pylori]NHB34409.1 restriction endonuclease subunit S [Helicobacter pylori]
MDALTTPSNWQKVRLGDIAEIIGGGTPSTQITSFWNGSINWFTPTEIGITKYVYKSQRTITPLGLKNSSAKLLPIGTILLTSRASIGDCAILKVVATTNQGFQSLIPLEKINNEFLYYLILTLKNKLLKLASGSTFLEVSPNKIKNLLIPLPPLNEQIAIANILSALDHYLCALDALILKKEGVKKALSFELLSQRKRLKGFNQNWQKVKVKDFGIIITGSTPLTQISEYWNGTISWITPTDINDNKDIFNSERKITQKGLDTIRMIPKNSVLVTCIASIGKNAILRVNGACNQQINAIIPNKDFNADFVYYLMENNKQYLLGKAGVTATYIISKQVFEEIDFFVPKDLNEQIAIANILSGLDSEIISLKNKKRQFENIKKALNHDLMSAKIRVLNK